MKFWLQYHRSESNEVSASHVQCLINGWEKSLGLCKRKRRRGGDDGPEEIPAEVLEFIEQERQLLNNPANFAITDGKSLENMILPYLHHILEFYRTSGTGSKGFSIAPVCKMKRHFLTIDTAVLYELLKNVAKEVDPKLCPEWLTALGNLTKKAFFHKENAGSQKIAWDVTFNIDGLRKRRTFGRQINTDGVSMTVHFQVIKRQRKRHQKRIQGRPDEYIHIVAIDPGRVNLVAALDSSIHKTGRLTRGKYYSKAGINRQNEKTTLWEIPLRGVVSALSKTSIHTSSPSLTCAYRKVIVRNHERLWKLRFHKKHAREALACYAGKQRVMNLLLLSRRESLSLPMAQPPFFPL
eukprot:evm.model.NODE_18525_length_10442_cov_17.100555.1